MSDVSMSIAGLDLVEEFADAGHELILSGISGRDPVELELDAVNLPGTSGTRLIDMELPAREVRVPYVLVSSDAEERRAAGRLLGRLMGYGIQDVEFSDQDGYYRGVTRNAEGDSMVRFGRGELIAYCPQPYLYGESQTAVPAGGRIFIESNWYVEPVIVWQLNNSVGAAWVEVDGKRLTIDTGISSGQQVRIDCARKEVRIGGVLNVENVGRPGEAFPRVFDGSTVQTSPGGSIEFRYRARWT